MNIRFLSPAAIAIATLLAGGRATGQAAMAPGTESGFALFQKKCTTCHGNPAVEAAPSPETIRGMPPEKIYEALGPDGIMAAQGRP